MISTSSSAIWYDELSKTWFDPTVYGGIIRQPVMFDYQREQQEKEWPRDLLEARWREIFEKREVNIGAGCRL